MQRVRFRLRRRQTPEAPMMRWWSALSAPICTGFAGPDAAITTLAAVADRLALELHFSLDWRIADAAATVGSEILRDAHAELVKSIEHPSIPEAPVTNADLHGNASPVVTHSGGPWPRGFSHAFVTRYQLRVRAQSHASVSSDNGNNEWSPWEAYPDIALPKEVDRSMRLGGWFAGSASGSIRTGNPQARWYAVEVSQGKTFVLQEGAVVQVAIRLGDGIKWSAWRNTKEIVISVQPPRPARDGDVAKAEWLGNVCRVSWPPASAPLGLDSIEYQLVVEPDSAQLPPRIGAMLVAPAAHVRRDTDGQGGEAQLALRPLSKSRGAVSSSMLYNSIHFTASASGMHGSGGSNKQALTPITRDASNSAMTASEERDRFRTEQTNIMVEINDLCPQFRHGFSVLARYPMVGSRAFTRVFEVPRISQKSLQSLLAPCLQIARSLDQSNTSAVAASPVSPVAVAAAIHLPRPEQVVILQDSPQLRRWDGNGRGRVVLLAWKGLEIAPDGGANYLSSAGLEVQVAGVPLMSAGRVGADIDFNNDSDRTVETGSLAWQPCGVTAFTSVQGRPCAVIKDPPCLVQHFRLVDAVGMNVGPPSVPMVAFYERLVSPPTVELQVLGKKAPRALVVCIAFSLASSESTLRWATRIQVRFHVVSGSGEEDAWEELDPSGLDLRRRDEASVLVREEDGLELSCCYKFEVRLGDAYRWGPWSPSSHTMEFTLNPPVPQDGSGIKVECDGVQAKLSWPPFKPQTALASRFPSMAEMPVEYSVDVHSGAQRELVASLVTRETSVNIRPLYPSTSYSAHLVARWTRFSSLSPPDDAGNHLSAAFVTAIPPQQLAIGASQCFSTGCTGLPGLEKGTPDGGVGVSGRGPPVTQKTVARPALPQLVPALPPKFAARDPLSYALFSPQEPTSARPSSLPRRPWPPGNTLPR